MNKFLLQQNRERSILSRFLNQTRIIVLSFATVILIGTWFLMLPIASKNGINFIDAFFTATSATCVTGLSTIVVSNELTLFGEIVLLLLIQIGGLGFMTLASAGFVLVGKKLTLRTRLNMRDYLSENDMSVVASFALKIVVLTLIVEGIGAILLTIAFGFNTLYASLSHQYSFSNSSPTG